MDEQDDTQETASDFLEWLRAFKSQLITHGTISIQATDRVAVVNGVVLPFPCPIWWVSLDDTNDADN